MSAAMGPGTDRAQLEHVGVLRDVFMRHREQRLGPVTTGCSCGWCPATSLGSLLSQYATHLALVVERTGAVAPPASAAPVVVVDKPSGWWRR